MDGVKICKQAQNLANELNFSSGLQFTEGWLRGFKKRYDLHRRVAHGEKQSADEMSAERWVKEVWPLLVAKYGLENIFNCDETGMYDLEARGQTWSSSRINTFFH